MSTSIQESNESREDTIFRAFAMLQDAFESAVPEDLSGGVYIEAARWAKRMLEKITDSPEYLSECIVNGETLGAFLLQNLLHPLDPNNFDKHKWLTVAEVIGPDHAQTLYHAAVFTTKVA